MKTDIELYLNCVGETQADDDNIELNAVKIIGYKCLDQNVHNLHKYLKPFRSKSN